MTNLLRDGRCIAALFAIQAAIAWIVPPIGEFPFLDDFDYADTVKDLLETGELRLSDYPAVPLVAHVVWGALFAKALGFSYFALRIAGLTAGVLAAIGLYVLARQMHLSQAGAFFLSLLLLFNPILMSLEYTFFTDPTGLMFLVWSLAAWMKASRCGSLAWAFVFGLLLAAAYLTRPPAAVPGAVCLAALCSSSFTERRALWLCFAAALPPVVIVGAFLGWLHLVHGAPYSMDLIRLDYPILWDAPRLSRTLLSIVLPLGLCLSPLSIGFRFRTQRQGRSGAAIFAALLALAWFGGHDGAPYSGLYVYDCGVGMDTSVQPPGRTGLEGPALHAGGVKLSAFATVAKLLAWWGATVLIYRAVGGIRSHGLARPFGWSFFIEPGRLVAVGAFVSAFLLLLVPVRETYLLPTFACALLVFGVAALGPPNVGPSVAAWSVVVGFGLFGLGAVQDVMTRQRTIWRAIDDLKARGVASYDVNGGWEYAGVFRFRPQYRNQGEAVPPFLRAMTPERREEFIAKHHPFSYYVAERAYTLSLQPIAGFRTEKSYPYRSWFRSGEILLLHRER